MLVEKKKLYALVDSKLPSLPEFVGKAGRATALVCSLSCIHVALSVLTVVRVNDPCANVVVICEFG
jgi:hypothetical protein